MVAGHLSVKHGNYYAVLNYKNAEGKRKTKWISLGLPKKGNKRKAEAELARIRSEFVPPQEVGELASDMPFADYLLEWLEIVKVRGKATTFSSYEQKRKVRQTRLFTGLFGGELGIRTLGTLRTQHFEFYRSMVV